MKTFRMLLFVVAFATFMIAAHAQTRLVTTGVPTSGSLPPAAAPGSIAVIDSSAFTDEKTGIARLMSAVTKLDASFEGRRNELKGMQARYDTMRSDLQKKQGIQSPSVTAKQQDEADQLQLQIKRKTEDAQADYQKQMSAALEPLQQDIGGALKAYAQAKGIQLIIDVSRVPVAFVADGLDITKDFIAEYNRTHPAGAAPATAPTRP
jgi:Skp family chaperone for outer membrane proteins